MQFYALIEEWPDECMAFFRELPGCYCSAPTYQEMMKAVPGAVADYLKWVKANDITILEEFDGQIEIVEKERIVANEGGEDPVLKPTSLHLMTSKLIKRLMSLP